jgi:histidinol-phosphate phosphatase family protein
VKRAAFLDRDGVLNRLVADARSGLPESPLAPADVALLPGAAAAAARLAGAGFVLVGVSNQPAAAKGTVALEQLEAVHARVIELLASAGVAFDAFQVCWHHPEALITELAGPCECRKPAPGMLLEAAAALDIDLARSWMVGDSDSDILAGRAAGTRTILVEHPASAHKRLGVAAPDATAPDLAAAATRIIDRD